jgi:hypothetical protein
VLFLYYIDQKNNVFKNVHQAMACEVLARRIIHISPPGRLGSIMSTRFRHIRADGEESDLSSALELAIDSHWSVPGYLTLLLIDDLTLARSFCRRLKLKMVKMLNFLLSHTTDTNV